MPRITVAERIEALLDHLHIERAHVCACMSGDWGGLVAALEPRVASLAVVAPHLNKGLPAEATTFHAPAMIITGDIGPPAERARSVAGTFANAELVELPGYASPIWADTVAERLHDVEHALQRLWSSVDASDAPAPACLEATDDSYAGVRFHVQGEGPPVVLFPLSLSAAQWKPLVERIRDRYCVITLGGAHLGAVALLEGRATSAYGELVASVLDAAELGGGEVALEVGCGSGALSRGLLARCDPSARIVATDLNSYMLDEAEMLASAEGISARIRFEAADGTRLPYRDDEFDVAFSSTVLEEADASRMLAEMVRVTRPGGRIAAITRAIDVDWCVNLDLPEALRHTLNTSGPKTGAGVDANGCADLSLYQRARDAGVRLSRFGPQFAAYRDGERLDDVLSRLSSSLFDADFDAFQRAVEHGRSNGTLLVCEPFHCLVGEVG